jgi:type II secretory pathway component PulF
MPTFTYQARDLKGIDHKGTIETSDAHQVARILSKKGLVVITVRQQNEKKDSYVGRFFNRVSFSDVVISTRQLATMIESGLVLSESLDILAEQQKNKYFKAVLSEISRDIKGGLDLASAFRKHPDVFPSLYASLIRAGEQAGKLDLVLGQMATSLGKDREFRARVRGAMIYPVVVITMMGAVITIMMIFVIPRLTSLYTQSSIDLPLPTKILIFVSNLFTQFWYLMLVGIIGSAIVFNRWVKTSSGKFIFDSILLKTPVVSKVIVGSTLTNFTRTFGLLTTAGVPLLDSLNIVTDVIGNAVYKKAFRDTFKGVERGLAFSTQLDAVGVFPKIVSQMYRVGEETGKVDKVSFKMAEYFESETDNLVKNMTVIIEPIVLVVLGVGVGFLVLSIILPIYKLTTSVSQ